MLTGLLYTDARRSMECPTCGARPGEVCLQPSGRKRTDPHAARVNALLGTGYRPTAHPQKPADER